MPDEAFRDNERRNFWCAAGELREALQDGAPCDLIDPHLDEIEGIALHTQQDRLRQRCQEILAEHRPPLSGVA